MTALVTALVATLVTALVLGMSACAAQQVTADRQPAGRASTGPTQPAAPPPPAVPPTHAGPEHAAPPSRAGTAARTATALPVRAPTMLRAMLSIPSIDLGAVPVVPYRGSPDDGPGTRIQNGGVAASPFGVRGGVGPGQVGNYIVTAHRTSGHAPFADLPAMRRGEHVLVAARGRVFDYRVVGTRSTSFRSQRSLARQSAAVPGHPGRRATRVMITLSTCATPEDHAQGNYWADEFGNPEHRIDKIGVLVDVRPA